MIFKRLTRTELNAVAARAKAGDRGAFEQLIAASIALYYRKARWIPVQYRDDVVADSISHTHSVLASWDVTQHWNTYVGLAIARHQQRSYARMAHALTVAEVASAKISRVDTPDRAGGIADPAYYGASYTSVLDQLEDKERLQMLREELALLPAIQRDALLMELPEWQTVYGFTRQRRNQIQKEVMTTLRERMELRYRINPRPRQQIPAAQS